MLFIFYTLFLYFSFFIKNLNQEGVEDLASFIISFVIILYHTETILSRTFFNHLYDNLQSLR